MRKVLFSVFISASLLCTTAFASVNDDQVTSQKIKEADGTSAQNTNGGSGVKTGHIQNGAVTGAKIAADTITNGNIASGAVTDSKISGQISASKINSTGLNADTVDGVHAAEFAPATHAHAQSDVTGLADSLAGKADINHNHDSVYQKKYANVVVVAKSGGDFTDPIAAINSITDASAGNPYLLKIMPGVYDLGSSTLYMKEFVDIEGAGETVTVITSTVSDPTFNLGTVNGASNAEIRFLTVQNTGSTGSTTAIALSGSVSVKLTHISVLVSNSVAFGNAFGISSVNNGLSFSLTNSTVQVVGGSSVVGVYIWGGESFPVLANVNISATCTVGDSGCSYGIQSSYSHPTIDDANVSASGPHCARAIQILYEDSVLTNVTSTASSTGVEAIGLFVGGYSSNIIMRNVTATGMNANNNYGLYYSNTSIIADRCTFEGSTNSIRESVGIAKIGASKLVGVTYGGGCTCVASYDGNYAPLNASCQ